MRISSAIKALIGLQLLIAILASSLALAQIEDPVGPTGRGQMLAGIVWGSLTIALTAVQLASGLLWCWWTMCVTYRLRAADPKIRLMASKWLMSWFVLGPNLIVPFIGVRRLRLASAAIHRGWGGSLLFIWWGFWATHQIGMWSTWIWLVLGPEGPVAWSQLLVIGVVRDLALVGAVVPAVLILSRITRAAVACTGAYVASPRG